MKKMQSKKRSQIPWRGIHVYAERNVEYATERRNTYKYLNKHVRRRPLARRLQWTLQTTAESLITSSLHSLTCGGAVYL